MRITYGVVFHSEADLLEKKIVEFDQFFPRLFFEAVFVLNSCPLEMKEKILTISKQHPHLPLMIFEQSQNHLGQARQLILQKASGEWIYFSDPDCELQASAQEHWLLALDSLETEKIGALGGGNRPPDQKENLIYQMLEIAGRHPFLHQSSIQIARPQTTLKVPLLSTSNMMVQKNWAQRAGGFDHDFAKVGEDMAFCHRLRKVGATLVAVPEVEVVHRQCSELKPWFHKMLGYGRAQVRVAQSYPKHFAGMRGATYLLTLLVALAFILWPAVFLLMVGFYTLVILLLFWIKAPEHRPKFVLKIAGLFLLTQMFYALGEIVGTFLLTVETLRKKSTS
ncbi:MAG: glycosyltransferase [Bdellovibrio sp.]|jgi:GT2 family glycosyltransferase